MYNDIIGAAVKATRLWGKVKLARLPLLLFYDMTNVVLTTTAIINIIRDLSTRVLNTLLNFEVLNAHMCFYFPSSTFSFYYFYPIKKEEKWLS